ncbi:MAG: alpha/beta hydrolase family protein [Vicinamibacterales bacterium]
MTGSIKVYPSARATAALMLAHGAGAGQQSPFMVFAAHELARRGVTIVTFDFPYIVQKRKVPDRGPVLEQAWREAIEAARREPALGGLPLFIGGKSMGGRIASQVAATGIGIEGVRGLVFLGYPLHPPRKPDQRRDRHLPDVQVPMLFVQGSRDDLGTADEIRALLPSLRAPAALVVVEGGDHSFNLPARLGRTSDAVLASVFDAVAAFVGSHRDPT